MDITVLDIYKYVKVKINNLDENTSAKDALFDVYNYIKRSMNTSYGNLTQGSCNYEQKNQK